MKHSVRRQMIAIFIGLFAFVLGAVMIINNSFLGSYYLSHKSEELIRTYNQVNKTIEGGGLSNMEELMSILIRTEKANVDIVSRIVAMSFCEPRS